MRFRLRTLLIVLAIGLVLLRVGLRFLPAGLDLPGGMLTWGMFVVFYHYVIPLAFLVTLGAIFIYSDTAAN